jgi:hypothetical protein
MKLTCGYRGCHHLTRPISYPMTGLICRKGHVRTFGAQLAPVKKR